MDTDWIAQIGELYNSPIGQAIEAFFSCGLITAALLNMAYFEMSFIDLTFSRVLERGKARMISNIAMLIASFVIGFAMLSVMSIFPAKNRELCTFYLLFFLACYIVLLCLRNKVRFFATNEKTFRSILILFLVMVPISGFIGYLDWVYITKKIEDINIENITADIYFSKALTEPVFWTSYLVISGILAYVLIIINNNYLNKKVMKRSRLYIGDGDSRLYLQYMTLGEYMICSDKETVDKSEKIELKKIEEILKFNIAKENEDTENKENSVNDGKTHNVSISVSADRATVHIK